ncbi:LamG domain-containing protein [Candidatus Poribacteria bacterium]|nr:LamG domain-containing protein [Candidatus Poribacteria bacterium]
MNKFFTLSLIILGLCLLPFFVKADLLLHYQFNEGAGDTVKATVGKDGKLGNKSGANPKWVDGPSPAGLEGRFGKAIDLDGKTNFVEIPMDLSPQATDGAITIAAWVKVHATALDTHGQNRQPVVMKGNGTAGWEYALYVYDDFKLGFSVWNCGGSGVSEPSSTDMLTKDKWHYVAGSFGAKEGSKAYIDGKLVTADTPPNANIPCDGTANVFIGHREDGQFLSATVDEVRIWNEVLSQQEIASFMLVPVQPAGCLTATWGKLKAGY